MTAFDGTEMLLKAEGLTKRFGSLTALEDVSLDIAPGERHALVGENGAGKSTLVKTLFGLLTPDSGTITWQGKPLMLRSPAQARALGIGMVHQHFSIFDALSVAENIALALPEIPLADIDEQVRDLSETYGLRIDPSRGAHSLSAGAKQRVEIIRCLMQDPRLLILDEPTSVLTPQEAETLFHALRLLTDRGCAILYITHRLGEVATLCEEATVLRRGRVVGNCDPRETPTARIAEMMVGSKIAPLQRPQKPEGDGPLRLRLHSLSVPKEKTGGRALRDLYLKVHGYEIVGIAGVAGEGQNELMAAITGEITLPLLKGTVEINGKRIAHRGVTERRRMGAAFVPEDRTGHAAVPAMDLADNLLLTRHAESAFSRRGLLDRIKAREWVGRVRDAFDVRIPGERPPAASLSGGNLQKFIMGREILRAPKVLVVNQPTWGVDAAAAQRIRQGLIDLAAEGAGVLVISQDLDELFALCDRIAVMHRGRLTPARPVEWLDAEAVGLMMSGETPDLSKIAAARSAERAMAEAERVRVLAEAQAATEQAAEDEAAYPPEQPPDELADEPETGAEAGRAP
ncbi:MAG: ABC transporter ATP-binding protein [Pseudomonadota bacterium]